MNPTTFLPPNSSIVFFSLHSTDSWNEKDRSFHALRDIPFVSYTTLKKASLIQLIMAKETRAMRVMRHGGAFQWLHPCFITFDKQRKKPKKKESCAYEYMCAFLLSSFLILSSFFFSVLFWWFEKISPFHLCLANVTLFCLPSSASRCVQGVMLLVLYFFL